MFPTLAGVPALIPTEADLVHMALGHGHVKDEPGRMPPPRPGDADAGAESLSHATPDTQAGSDSASGSVTQMASKIPQIMFCIAF